MADDSMPDWRRLAPHRPLAPGDPAYAVRPGNGGDAIAAWIAAGGSTVVVGGPTGVGKSTELAHAAQLLRSVRVACLVQVDRMANIHRLVADELMRLIAKELVTTARDYFGLTVSSALASATDAAVLEYVDPTTAQLFTGSGVAAVMAALNELARVSNQGRIALLIDGLEKLPPGPAAAEIFETLSALPETVDLVVVIPWHATFGGGTESILRPGERMHRITAIDPESSVAMLGMIFLREMLTRRIAGGPWSHEVEGLVGQAVRHSGGIPRVFLQLVGDAGTYARVKRGAAWPDQTDLQDAIHDQQDSFRRALLPGDTQAIRTVAGTDGRELELDRRVRLLAQGILLERVRQGQPVLEPHPLVAAAVRSL